MLRQTSSLLTGEGLWSCLPPPHPVLCGQGREGGMEERWVYMAVLSWLVSSVLSVLGRWWRRTVYLVGSSEILITHRTLSPGLPQPFLFRGYLYFLVPWSLWSVYLIELEWISLLHRPTGSTGDSLRLIWSNSRCMATPSGTPSNPLSQATLVFLGMKSSLQVSQIQETHSNPSEWPQESPSPRLKVKEPVPTNPPIYTSILWFPFYILLMTEGFKINGIHFNISFVNSTHGTLCHVYFGVRLCSHFNKNVILYWVVHFICLHNKKLTLETKTCLTIHCVYNVWHNVVNTTRPSLKNP